jgi:hypothetical protein
MVALHSSNRALIAVDRGTCGDGQMDGAAAWRSLIRLPADYLAAFVRLGMGGGW